jgi:Arylsulfotransferase (ASST)
VIADSSYREVARVHAGNGLAADIHEFLLTPRDTALITVYRRLPFDLSPVGGPRDGEVFEGVIQELEIPSGRVLFEWHSLPEVGIDESYAKVPPASQGAAAAPYDYFHVNSVDEYADGNLLLSARNTQAIYKIDRATGKVAWRLGGKQSDFELGPGTRFGWQHDARWRSDRTISLFDNEADPPLAKSSRGLLLHVDTEARKVELAAAYTHPAGLLSGSQGNSQFLPDGHVLVGWGANPYFTEFDRDGTVLFDAHFTDAADSYRAYRFVWSGRPEEPPALGLVSDRRGRVTAYASWNGATDVARWRVLAGADEQHLHEVATVPRSGFETEILLGYLRDRYVAVQAQGASGERLGASLLQKRPAR